jgi:hypothetical protein
LKNCLLSTLGLNDFYFGSGDRIVMPVPPPGPEPDNNDIVMFAGHGVAWHPEQQRLNFTEGSTFRQMPENKCLQRLRDHA